MKDLLFVVTIIETAELNKMLNLKSLIIKQFKNPISLLKSYSNNRLYFTLTMCLFVFLCNKKGVVKQFNIELVTE